MNNPSRNQQSRPDGRSLWAEVRFWGTYRTSRRISGMSDRVEADMMTPIE
jgi:hypothetical protein